MVEVFKTNINENGQASQVIQLLSLHFPSFKINFDLDDCDRILRVEGNSICSTTIREILSSVGFQVEVLE